MSPMYRFFIFINLFAVAFYGMAVIFSIIDSERDINIWHIVAVAVFLFFYFHFKKKHQQFVEQEGNDRTTQKKRPKKKK